MSAQERNLKKWLDSNINSSRRYGKLEKIQIRHVQRGNKVGDEISFFEVPEEASESWSEDTTREILESLASEAENLGGVQKFACYAYFSKSDEPVNRHVVRMASERQGEEEEKSLDSEGSDSAGLVSQSMRHTEAFARLATQSANTQIGMLLRLVDKQGQMVEALMSDKLDSIKIVNELLDKRMERELQIEDAKTKRKAVEAGIESAKLLAPVVANKLLKKKLFPEANNVLAKLGNQFFKSIAADPKKLSGIVDNLDQNQRVALMELIEAFEMESEETTKNGTEAKA